MSKRKKQPTKTNTAPRANGVAVASGGSAVSDSTARIARQNTQKEPPKFTNFVLNSDLYPEISPQVFRQAGKEQYFDYGSAQGSIGGAGLSLFEAVNAVGRTIATDTCYQTPLLQLIQQAIVYSPTNSRILDAKANYAFGGTILLKEDSPKYERNLEVLKRLNIPKILRQAGYDYFAYNNTFIELKKERGEIRIARLPIDYVRLRGGNNAYLPTEIGFSFEWGLGSSVASNITNIPIFNEREYQYGNTDTHTAFFVKGETAGRLYWALPNYFACLPSCEVEYHAPRGNANYFKNGFKMGGILILKKMSAADDEANKAFIEDIKNPENFHKVLAHFSQANDMQGDPAQWIDTHTFTEGAFLKLTESAQKEILIAHGFTASIAGIETAGKLGSSQNIQTEFEIILNGQIRPAQKVIIDEFLLPAFREIDATYKTTLEADFMGLEPVMPASMRGSINPADVLTRDEQRAQLGYAPLTEEQQQAEDVSVVKQMGVAAKIKNFFNKLKFWDNGG